MAEIYPTKWYIWT